MKPANKAQLVDILTYHVVSGNILSTDLESFQAVKTVEGKPLHVVSWGGVVQLGPSLQSLSKVTAADNKASNGVVHIIDGVLLPPAKTALGDSHAPNIVELAESVKDLSTLVAAVVAGDLVDTLSSPGPFTVFAPTNAGFGKLPAGTLDSLMKPENKGQLVDILTYHVLAEEVLSKNLKPQQGVATVEGKTLQVFKDSKGVRVTPDGKDFKSVTSADNKASNGVVHIIDGVLIPTTLPNIVELAESQKALSTLVAAVVAGDLVDTLSSPGLFTVFAPTNEAFGNLPAGTLDSLMKPENKAQLVDILTFHVLPSQVKSTDLTNFQAVTTVEGKPLHVVLWGGVVRLGPSLKSEDLSTVTAADNLASNGVVHIIDGVLLPPAKALVV
jgi:transforming growth factor-beta-induced protein